MLKGGSWYLAGHIDGSVRTYRVARVLDCNVLDEHFVRPADFDLAAYWQASTIRLEAEMHPNIATVRLSPFGIKLLNALSQPYVKTRARIEERLLICQRRAGGRELALLEKGITRIPCAIQQVNNADELVVVGLPEVVQVIRGIPIRHAIGVSHGTYRFETIWLAAAATLRA